MIILLIFYLLFLFVYLAFNAYCVFRVSAMRIRGDVTGAALLIYILAILIIIGISLVFISVLDWNSGLGGGLLL